MNKNKLHILLIIIAIAIFYAALVGLFLFLNANTDTVDTRVALQNSFVFFTILATIIISFLLIYFCRSPVGKIFNQLLFFTNLLSITAPAANIKIAINCDVDNTPTAPLGSFLKNSIRKRPTA